MARRTSILALVLLSLMGFTTLVASEKLDKPDKTQEEYYDLFRTLVDAIDQVDRNYVKEVDRRELVEAAIEGVLSKLDPYSTYISPEEISRFRSTVESHFGGIGIQVTMDDGQLKVISPLVGTPAYKAGIVAGDRILAIDGKTTEEITLEDAVKMLKGKDGTKVTLTIVHPGATKRIEVPVVRGQIHVDTVLGDHRGDNDTWEYVLDGKQGIGYIRVTAFSRDTATEIRKTLEELRKKGMRALILDLRFNPGGLLSSAIEVSDLFVPDGRIVSTKGRNSPERVWDARKDGTFDGFPMVVLVNRYSASASEIVSACLQDHKRAVVMGERTWGKGSVQNVINLDSGHSALKLTTAAYRRPSGKNIHRFKNAKNDDEWGVMPDPVHRLRLPDGEMLGLIEYQRRRDIVRPHPQHPSADTTQGETPTDDEAAGDDSATKSDENQTTKSASSAEEATSEKDVVDQDNTAAEKPFVDRQLQMAVGYLSDELARVEK